MATESELNAAIGRLRSFKDKGSLIAVYGFNSKDGLTHDLVIVSDAYLAINNPVESVAPDKVKKALGYIDIYDVEYRSMLPVHAKSLASHVRKLEEEFAAYRKMHPAVTNESEEN